MPDPHDKVNVCLHFGYLFFLCHLALCQSCCHLRPHIDHRFVKRSLGKYNIPCQLRTPMNAQRNMPYLTGIRIYQGDPDT